MDTSRELAFETASKKNCLRWGTNETWAHANAKWLICFGLKRLGYEFYTEAVFKNGSGRADIIVADTMTCIEIADSEELPSLKAKQERYPLDVIFVDANDFEPDDVVNSL